MRRIVLTVLWPIVLVATGCDTAEGGRYEVEVMEVRATEASSGAPSFTVRLRNSGQLPLGRAEIEFTLHPQSNPKAGASTLSMGLGTEMTVEVILHVAGHGDYDCYTSRLRAFNFDGDAVIDRDGPSTCE